MTLSRIIGIGGMILLLWMVGPAILDGRSPSGPGSISLRSTEPLRVSSAHAVTIPIANGELK